MIERYTRPQMGKIWTLENRYRCWLRAEIAVCEAWNAKGMIPDADLNEIREKAEIDVDRILEIEETTRHDIIAFLTSLEEKIGPASRFIHLGCTSSDIVDTAGALQMVEAGNLILEGFDRLLGTLKTLALKHKGLLCMGRTHGIHAEPTSFALKMATFYAEIQRNKQRFAAALEGVRVGKFSGAVGTYLFLTPDIEADACSRLGLKPDTISTQVIQRDRHAAYFTALAVAAGSIERLCVELRHLQRTEVHEVEEGFSKGQKGSSAMPHKKNPISAENMTGLARIIRSNSIAAMENQALWHERDISHSSVERIVMPDSTILMDYILHRLSGVLENLRVLPENMARNIDASFGLYTSQRVLTALVESGMPRQEAYVLVQRNAMTSWETRQLFPDLIRQDADIAKHLDAQALDALFDSSFYLKHEDELLDRVFSEGAAS
ncbi:MAG: adenylosuccinate lyase [Desulfovibrionaceae bacterium]|nr:adenylosuccinate lyase [Desulfovibrionaceae bacterium]